MQQIFLKDLCNKYYFKYNSFTSSRCRPLRTRNLPQSGAFRFIL